MSAVPMSRPTVGKLSIGISRMTIRLAHTQRRYKKPQPELAGHPPDHGEKIFVWDHVRSKQVVHTMFPILDVYKAHSQLPFSGKKSKPAKIRKDLWQQLCIVEFPKGRGDVGQSVFTRLREFRRRHELEWGDEMFRAPVGEDGKGGRMLTRQERGIRVQEQKENAIADLAAVLAGAGRGNRILRVVNGGKEGAPRASKKDEAGNKNIETTEESTEESIEESKKLVPATIHWANSVDKNYATEWSSNVTHAILPNGVIWELVEDGEDSEAAEK